MQSIFKKIPLIIAVTLLCFSRVEAKHENLKETVLKQEKELDKKRQRVVDLKSPSPHVSKKAWKQVHPYLIPNHHPIKQDLDKIFSASRVFCTLQSMVAAGFDPAIPQHHTKIIVTRHPELKGYVIKAYLDDQPYHSEKPEHYYWIKRATGARLIQAFIKSHKYEHLMKAPNKWIYPLPSEPSPPSGCLRKNFILVEEDMNIYDDCTTKKLWGSKKVTKELVKAMYKINTKLGLFDCAKPENCPFSQDGKVAFIDTQSYHKDTIKYHRLTPYLSYSMKHYWHKLIKKGKKKD